MHDYCSPYLPKKEEPNTVIVCDRKCQSNASFFGFCSFFSHRWNSRFDCVAIDLKIKIPTRRIRYHHSVVFVCMAVHPGRKPQIEPSRSNPEQITPNQWSRFSPPPQWCIPSSRHRTCTWSDGWTFICSSTATPLSFFRCSSTAKAFLFSFLCEVTWEETRTVCRCSSCPAIPTKSQRKVPS